MLCFWLYRGENSRRLRQAKEKGQADAFWREHSFMQLTADQEGRPLQRREDILGKGADWKGDEEFEAFLQIVDEHVF